jgi:cytochrome c oxidase assembly protein subunit 15
VARPSARGLEGPWRHRLAALLVASTLVLVFIGGLVTSTGSGLSVPDWPLSYGMLMPPMVGGVFYEHGHRMAASAVGFLTLVLALWTARREPRAGVRRLAWATLGAVILQGVLGGLTVIFLLPPAISVAHACLAQVFFCLTIWLAYATSAEWLASPAAVEDPGGLRGAAATATGLVFLQLFLGALMRHLGAGLAIPDFPLALGGLVPPSFDLPVAVHFAHRVGAILVLAGVLRLFSACQRSSEPGFLRAGWLILAMVLVQVALGAATVLTGKAVTPTTTHVATGAAILGSCWYVTLRSRRLLRARAASAVPAGLGQAALS